MSNTENLPATQRAYTLRLAGNDSHWRNDVWHTHLAVNRGAAAFGDWLLTLRGGLDHRLADLPELTPDQFRQEFEELKKTAHKNNQTELAEADARQALELKRHEQIKDYRVALALSWLSVEVGYRGPFFISGEKQRPVDVLRQILKNRGLSTAEIEDWDRDCRPSLSAEIKEGAVWVNRSAAFDAAVSQVGPSLNRDELWDLLLPFFGSQDFYLKNIKLKDVEGGDSAEEKAKDLVQKAGQWLSSRFGRGQGADFAELARIYETISSWAGSVNSSLGVEEFFVQITQALASYTPTAATADAVLNLISGPGYKSATRNLIKRFAGQPSISGADLAELAKTTDNDFEACLKKVGGKGNRVWSDRLLAQVQQACGFTYLGDIGRNETQPPVDEDSDREAARHFEYAVMLDHAARRVCLAHTWIKRAEAERRQFATLAAKRQTLCQSCGDAVKILDDYCAQRSLSSFADDDYRIRPRAVQGWKEVVASWQKADCATVQDRIEAARALQDSDQIEKFGDIQLFEALADDRFRTVWNDEPQILLDYAAAADAICKQQRFKVPAYCHPEPLRHPVFCDFGNSRWEVRFACHLAQTKKLENDRKSVITRRNEVAELELQLSKAKTEAKQLRKAASLENARRKLGEAETELTWLEATHALTLTLLQGCTPRRTSLSWQSKRLTSDLALEAPTDESAASPVTRATRQARAAAAVRPTGSVRILGLFNEKTWNARLQAPRKQLDHLADYLEQHHFSLEDESSWDDNARRQRDHIKWLITFSAKLQPQGPWVDYINDHGAKKGTRELSRLPNLRLLSVDLGHRYGAACAVWETLSREQLETVCAQAGVQTPSPDAMYFQIQQTDAGGKARTTLFRRLGPDTLNAQNHPAPWARLNRQFLVKLQGEEATPRMASPAERSLADDVESACGIIPEFRLKQQVLAARQSNGHGPSLNVDSVMEHVVDTLRLALKRRHATRARMARDLNNLRPPGIGGKIRIADLEGHQLRQHLLDLFLAWFALAYHRKAPDAAAKELWETHIEPHLESPMQTGEERETIQVRKQRQATNEKSLAPAVEYWMGRDRSVIAAAWHRIWANADAQFPPLLRRLADWLRPGGNKTAPREQRIALRRLGGISQKRLITLRNFWNIQKAFAGRERWDDANKCWQHTPPGEAFGQRTLDAIERLREQRVKQLASRIATAALGLAPAAPPPNEQAAGGQKAVRLARQRLSKLEHRFPACHAVVIESLTNYRPDQVQTRRENRQLMQWSSSKVKKYLAEACQLSGLHLREIPPAYTSRQDSRSGAPGLRCCDVSLADFLRQGGFWEGEVSRLSKKQAKREPLRPRDQLLLETFAHWKQTPMEARRSRSIRLIQDGAELFVSANANSPAAKGLQADLNAAANIGLKALLDPDWEGTWWKVPCSRNSHAPKPDAIQGCLIFKNVAQLGTPSISQGKSSKKKGEYVNLWRNVSALSISSGIWLETLAYWSEVERQVAAQLRGHNGLPPEDDIPM